MPGMMGGGASLSTGLVDGRGRLAPARIAMRLVRGSRTMPTCGHGAPKNEKA